MDYLICQEWSNTTNNHAGIKYLCMQMEKRHPNEYKAIVIPDYNKNFSKWSIVRVIKKMWVDKMFKRYIQKVFSQLSAILQSSDRVFLMEYMELLYPQLWLAKQLKQKFPEIKLYGLVHLVPSKLEQGFGKDAFVEWTDSVDVIMTLGSSLSKYFINKGLTLEKVFTAFHYVDDYYYNQNPIHQHEIPRVIAMGNQMRNVALLQEIVKKSPNIEFTICQGVADLSRYFEHYQNVQLIPFVSEEELRQYMLDSDISLNVMKDTIGSNVIVTSMAMGLAMVCSDVGSIRDYCDEDNTIFCLNEDPQTFSTALQKLSTDEKLLIKMKKASRENARRLCIESFCKYIQQHL